MTAAFFGTMRNNYLRENDTGMYFWTSILRKIHSNLLRPNSKMNENGIQSPEAFSIRYRN